MGKYNWSTPTMMKSKEYFLLGFKGKPFDESWNKDYFEGDSGLEGVLRSAYDLGVKAKKRHPTWTKNLINQESINSRYSAATCHCNVCIERHSSRMTEVGNMIEGNDNRHMLLRLLEGYDEIKGILRPKFQKFVEDLLDGEKVLKLPLDELKKRYNHLSA